LKRLDNHKKYLGFRQDFPVFIFQSYSFEVNKQGLTAEFIFELPGKCQFRPGIKLPQRNFYHFDKLSKEALENLVFHIGMVELISYWKAACSPRLIIKPHALNPEQIRWWKKLYFHGLGEFFYLNGIDAGEEDFMQITTQGEPTKLINNRLNDSKTLVPVGGGKDSIVTLELLKDTRFESLPFVLNPREASERTIEIAGYSMENSIVVERSFDKQLLELNSQGFLNGHTPFSALLAFSTALAALASGVKFIALSNESSANESTVPGSTVNHQYSKSFAFEQDFVSYSRKYLHPELSYFSFLRPVNELQIARLFSGFPQHFDSFRSCNVGSKTDSWCGSCPKCLFTYSILSPFIPSGKLKSIFGKDLFADENLLPVFDELTGKSAVKPFECVGTPDEVQAALGHTISKMKGTELPFLLKQFQPKVSAGQFENLLSSYEEENYLTEGFAEIIKTALFHSRQVDFKAFLENLPEGNKKVLILGFGREGRSSYQLLRSYFPELEIGIADQQQEIEAQEELRRDKYLTLHLGKNYKNAIPEYDLVLKSPGVSLREISISDASKISSQTDLFLRVYRNQTIGVTGTKGKSTTASLIAHLLKEAGKKVVLLGNIGVPAFDMIAQIDQETIVVFELSAHQLEYLHSSPRVAILLNVFPEHLDHFDGFEKYREAKKHIFKYQLPGDVAITEAAVENPALQISLDTDSLPLKGVHNQKNMLFALQAVSAFGVDVKQAIPYLQSFKPLPHRLEFVGEFDGIQFYNDSISTVPESAIAALETLKNVETLILGGYDRGIDYSGLVRFLMKSRLSNIIFLGKAGETMLGLFEKETRIPSSLFLANNLKEALVIVK
jgi:UDP-N-acetylmuramoylalanine-D-glutamate ligase